LSYSNLPRQIASFSFVGLCSNLLGYGAYLLIVANGMDPKITVTLLYFIGVLASYFANKRLTFRCTRSILSSGIRYLSVYILGYLINLSLIALFVDGLGVPHQLVQGIAILVVAVVMFIMLRLFVFGRHSSSGQI